MKAALLSLVALSTIALAGGPEESLYDFTMKDIDGKATPLSKFKGKVVMVVNVASKCGNTPQYATLEKLYKEKKGQGFAVLGFPANEFRGQEPGTDEDIKEFCTQEYGVTFPMFSKIVVKGEGTHPLYQWLIASTEPKADIDWNFAKFLIGRDGQVVARFSAKTKPDAPEVVAAIEKALQTGNFPDVPGGHWAERAVKELKDAGILRGYPGGSFSTP